MPTPAGSGRRSDVHVPGEEGIWVLILGEMIEFAVLYAVYVAERAKQPEVFRLSQEALHQSSGALNTLVLLTSSVCVATAIRAARTGREQLAPPLLAVGFACGLGFVLVKAFEYSELLGDGLTPTTNDFYMYYFLLTGIHLFHLRIGLAILIYLWRLARKYQPDERTVRHLEAGACFWHMVDMIWIVLFPLLYLVH